MTVSNQTPYNISTANGVTTSFACDFVVLESGDLEVRVDGVVKTYTTHYTITNLGGPSNAIVVFLSAPASGAVVERERIVPLTRSTDYQQSGDYLAETINDDFDRLWMALQGLSFDDGYSLHLAKADGEGVDMELPSLTATYFLRVNDDATGFEWYDIGDATLQIPADQSVNAAKMYASATDVLFGRSSSGAGAGQEIACTAAGRALLDDADAAAQRATLGAAASGAATGSGLTMATARMLGRTTASTGAVEEISVGAGLSLTGGALTVAAGGVVGGGYGEYTAYQRVTTVIPIDDTVPTSSEGTQLVSVSYTPTSATNKIRLTASVNGLPSVTAAVAAVFSGADCKRAQIFAHSSIYGASTLVVEFDAGTTSSTAYSLRVGVDPAGYVDINADFAGNRVFGGKSMCTLKVEEIKV